MSIFLSQQGARDVRRLLNAWAEIDALVNGLLSSPCLREDHTNQWEFSATHLPSQTTLLFKYDGPLLRVTYGNYTVAYGTPEVVAFRLAEYKPVATSQLPTEEQAEVMRQLLNHQCVWQTPYTTSEAFMQCSNNGWIMVDSAIYKITKSGRDALRRRNGGLGTGPDPAT